jgi:hypothetical protein
MLSRKTAEKTVLSDSRGHGSGPLKQSAKHIDNPKKENGNGFPSPRSAAV